MAEANVESSSNAVVDNFKIPTDRIKRLKKFLRDCHPIMEDPRPGHKRRLSLDERNTRCKDFVPATQDQPQYPVGSFQFPMKPEIEDEIESKLQYLERIARTSRDSLFPMDVLVGDNKQLTADYLDTRISAVVEMFQETMNARFKLVNFYCDTTMEPVVFNSMHKRWMVSDWGKFDCLDYIVCYLTKSIKQSTSTDQDEQHFHVLNVEDHWHYVSFGLSDVHGNGFYHPIQNNPSTGKSGFGFELTFRVKCEADEIHEGPPLWPVELLQKLALYIYNSGGILAAGDHISWNYPLDLKNSIISNIIVTTDSSIPTLVTTTGTVDFLQVVGVTSEEVEMARNWHSVSLLELFKTRPIMGGPALITDMKRQFTIFAMYPEVRELVFIGINRDGSNLSGVTSKIMWADRSILHIGSELMDFRKIEKRTADEYNQTRNMYFDNLAEDHFARDVLRLTNLLSEVSVADKDDNSVKGDSENDSVKGDSENDSSVTYYNSMHLTMDMEAGSLLPLALRGRVNHGRHFTFKSWKSDLAVTFVPPHMPGTFTTDENCLAAKGEWLHISLNQDSCNYIVSQISRINQTNKNQLEFPILIYVEPIRLAISIHQEITP